MYISIRIIVSLGWLNWISVSASALLIMQTQNENKKDLTYQQHLGERDIPLSKPSCFLYNIPYRRVTRGGRGGVEVSPALFQKLEKKALILGKNALNVVFYGLNFSFKMQFLRVSRNKTRDFPLRRKISLSCCAWLFIKVP